jgi:hypothetical protein
LYPLLNFSGRFQSVSSRYDEGEKERTKCKAKDERVGWVVKVEVLFWEVLSFIEVWIKNSKSVRGELQSIPIPPVQCIASYHRCNDLPDTASCFRRMYFVV